MLTPAAIAWAGWTATAVAWEVHHRRRVERVRHRVLVWGMRGKTSAVELLRAGFEGAGRRVLARVTGDEPLTIGPDGGARRVRRWGPPNIREMRRTARRAAALECDVLCVENMAIRPELAAAVASHCVRPTCVLFTFDGVDHGEVYPTDAAARAALLAATFPRDCPAVVCDAPRNADVRDALARRGVEVLDAVPLESERLRPHMRALAGAALCALEHGGIARGEVAEVVIERAAELQRLRVVERDGRTLVDLLSANDPDSVRDLMAILRDEGLLPESVSLLFAHRRDRPERLKAFVPLLRAHDAAIVGDAVPPRFLRQHDLRYMRKLETALAQLKHPTVLLVGNTHGAGARLRARHFAASAEGIDLW